jgi:hypothetical protein
MKAGRRNTLFNTLLLTTAVLLLNRTTRHWNEKKNYGIYGINGNYGNKRIFSVNSVNSVCSVVSLQVHAVYQSRVD